MSQQNSVRFCGRDPGAVAALKNYTGFSHPTKGAVAQSSFIKIFGRMAVFAC